MTSENIDLVWIDSERVKPNWPLGNIYPTTSSPSQLLHSVEQVLKSTVSHALVFWNSALGEPEPSIILKALAKPADVLHAGLKLGMNGLPSLIDFVSPTWMLNLDNDPEVESTSWRLSLSAAVVKTEVLRQLGFIQPAFNSFDAASLELGHRLISGGVILRHIPWLLERSMEGTRSIKLPLEDEVLFLRLRAGRFWARWALIRACLSGTVAPAAARQAWNKSKRIPDARTTILRRKAIGADHPEKIRNAKVTILIPTLERYPYLYKLLDQLRTQTIPPFEIIVIDQTSRDQRNEQLQQQFSDLPLKPIYLDIPGQCSSRNAGIQQASGDYILFLDDDVEVPENLIETHLKTLLEFSADSSSGVLNEIGAGELPPHFRYFRVSDVFPASNSLVPQSTLQRSGLFDLAYERGQRADGDLGMRIYQSGALMVLDPKISVLHHHAPRGGLRVHKARVITYASSRQRITHRHLPSNTEIYLARRYFTPKQVREMLWIRALGTFSIQGNIFTKLLKCVISFFSLPDTILKIRKANQEATRMLEKFPEIPSLKSGLSVQRAI